MVRAPLTSLLLSLTTRDSHTIRYPHAARRGVALSERDEAVMAEALCNGVAFTYSITADEDECPDPPGSTTAALYHCSTVPLQHCTTAALYHCSTVPLQHCTTVPLYHCSTVAALQHCTTAALQHCTTVPLQHCSTAALQQHCPSVPVFHYSTVPL
jgi:hypothetical protein